MRTLACIALPCWKADISEENSSPHGNWSMFIQQTIGCWDAYPRQLSHKVTRLQTFVQPWLLLLHTKRLSVAKQTRHLDLMLQARVQLCPKGCWATFHEKKGWRKAEMGNRHLTLQTAHWLLAHSSSSAEATGSGFVVLTHELWFTGQNPSRSCTVEYLFPEPSHLLTSFKAYQNNLKLTSYLDSLLPHFQVLGTGIPAHLPVSTPSLLTVLCCQAAMQGVFAPLNSLSYTAVKWIRSILPLPNSPVLLQQGLPYSLMPMQSLWQEWKKHTRNGVL